MDLNQINQAIDDSIKDQPPRNITPGVLRTILKAVTAYVNDLTSGKLSAWFKVGAGTPSLNDTDTVYRTGAVVVGRTTADATGASLQVQGGLSLTSVKLNENEAFGLSVDSGGDTSTVDFNNYQKSGTHVILGSTWVGGAHGPNLNYSGVWYYGLLTVIRREANDLVLQTYHTTDGEVFYRTKYFGGWGNWYCPSRNAKTSFCIGGTAADMPSEKLQVVGGNAQIDGYVRAGSGNKAFKLTGVKTGSGLSLKTTRYLEILLDDGTVIKVAEVN